MADNLHLRTDSRYEPLPPLPFDGLSPPGTPLHESAPIPMEEIPYDASRPRFQGMAARSESANIRDSYASSNYQGAGGSVNSSVYALNPGGAGAGAPGAGVRSSAYLAGYRDDPNADEFDDASSPGGSPGGAASPAPEYLAEKRAAYAPPAAKKKRWIWVAGLAGLCLLIAIVVGVYFGVVKKGNSSGSSSSSDSSSGSSGNSSSGSTSTLAITGGDGSTVTTESGTTFTYQNSFGGYWYYNPEDPFNNAARPQSWSPALNETFNYGSDIIRGYVTRNTRFQSPMRGD